MPLFYSTTLLLPILSLCVGAAPLPQRWRIRSDSVITGSWFVNEVRLFGDQDCSQLLSANGDVASRGFVPIIPQIDSKSALAFDGDESTKWQAGPGNPGERFVGLDFMGELATPVKCAQLVQGFTDGKYGASAVTLQSQEAESETWVDVCSAQSLGFGSNFVRLCDTPAIDLDEYLKLPLIDGSQRANGATIFDWMNRVVLDGGNLADAVAEIRSNTSANAVVVAPMWFTQNISSTEIWAHKTKTMSDDTARSMIQRAHALGMSTMLKVHVQLACDTLDQPHTCDSNCWSWAPNQTCARTNIGVNNGGPYGGHFTATQWDAWFASYRKVTLHYAALAAETKVEIFCLTTELSGPTTEPGNEGRWRALAAEVRAVLPSSATLTAALLNPDEVPWRDALDSIGYDMYNTFQSLSGQAVPSTREFMAAWLARGEGQSSRTNKCTSALEFYTGVARRFGHPVWFTEWGFKSVELCGAPGANGSESEACQANAFRAVMQIFGRQPVSVWGGGFWWDFTAHGREATSLGADAKALLQQAMRDAFSLEVTQV